MAIAQKMRDERRRGYKEIRAEMVNEANAALKGILDPAIIAERFNVPLERVSEIWGQE